MIGELKSDENSDFELFLYEITHKNEYHITERSSGKQDTEPPDYSNDGQPGKGGIICTDAL